MRTKMQKRMNDTFFDKLECLTMFSSLYFTSTPTISITLYRLLISLIVLFLETHKQVN